MNVKKSNTKLLLKYLAIGGAVALLSLVNPILPHYLIKAYFKNKKFQKTKFLSDLKRLQKRELIDYKEMKNGEAKIILKAAGKKLTLQYDIDDMKINRPAHWDGKWRLIIFDIPDKKRATSNALSAKLKELGFYRLQKSIYIFPFPCEKELEFIASIFDIRDHILLMPIADFDGDKKLMKHFNII
ncbi:MAG: CRISPR-associated endonuclease Cas2 [Parcubacteria group bacterium]|nr:CRISPR-associated endonuclease Cas2 [Parcubacteria group bacterium]